MPFVKPWCAVIRRELKRTKGEDVPKLSNYQAYSFPVIHLNLMKSFIYKKIA